VITLSGTLAAVAAGNEAVFVSTGQAMLVGGWSGDRRICVTMVAARELKQWVG
jgi:hypothetical protein